MFTTQLTISGMTCGHCEQQVHEALEALDGVSDVQVSHKDGSATVESFAEIAANELVQAVSKAGYTATVQ